MGNMEEIKIKDFKNIEKSIKKLNKNKQDIAKSLLNESKFCFETLNKLKEVVKAEGVVTEMEQGNYSITRENPALKSYNTTIKNYQNLMKQISELFNDMPLENKPDALEEFINN